MGKIPITNNQLFFMKKIVITFAVIIALFSGVALVYAAGAFGLQDTAAGAGYETANAPSISQTVGQIVQVVLGFVGLLFFGLALYGGLIWMTARGIEEKVTQAKGILEAAVIGIIIVAASYAIATFVISRLAPSAEKTGCCFYGNPVVQVEMTQTACQGISGSSWFDGTCQ